MQRNEEKLARWRRHFEKVLNVDIVVSEELVVGIMDNADVETPDVTWEVAEKAMAKLKNGKAAGNDIAAELLKNGEETMVDWVTNWCKRFGGQGRRHRSRRMRHLCLFLRRRTRRFVTITEEFHCSVSLGKFSH